ncbi:MAG: methyltransferase [Spirochaetaceae bacterium]|jgi:tRNA G10  N-methylase Trm11|nr:methyltransferase [Spirochaetaceae bacterium]
MKYKYYASFTPGLQKVVAEIVSERLNDVRISKLLDGAIIFETEVSYDSLNFFCFNNIFALISIADVPPLKKVSAKAAIEEFIATTCTRKAARNTAFAKDAIKNNNSKIQSFRVIPAIENTPAAVSKNTLEIAEDFIAELSGLNPSRHNPDTEFWFLYRKEGSGGNSFIVFLKRLTRHASWEKSLHPGELTPPLAYILCYLSKPKHGQKVLDPFCGYGSIPLARAKYFPQSDIYAADIDEKVLVYTKSKLPKTVHVINTDIAHLLYTEELHNCINTFDTIITDPPWGVYEKKKDLGRFYNDMLKTCVQLLKADGVVVMLTAATQELSEALKRTTLSITARYNILLSGKKASVFVLGNHLVNGLAAGDHR